MTSETTPITQPQASAQPSIQEIKQQQRVEAFEKVFGKKYLERFTDPIHFMDVQFYNYRIHKFYENNFQFISKNLFVQYVYRRRPAYNLDVLTRYHDIIAGKLAGVQKILTRYTGQVDAVMAANNGSDEDIGFVRQSFEKVPVIHGQARQYLDLLLMADALFIKVAAMVLQGLMDADQKTEIEKKVILTFRAVGNTVRSEAIKLRQEAQRVASALQSEGVQKDEELDSAIDMQQTVIEEAGAVEKTNAILDGVTFTGTEVDAAHSPVAASA
jgi:hypothetical protein